MCASPCLARGISDAQTWALCPPEPALPPKPQPVAPGLQPGTTTIAADQAKLIEKAISTFSGNVDVTHDDQALSADTITYNDPENTVEAKGHVRYWSNDLFWSGDKGRVDFDTSLGRFSGGSYRLVNLRGHGEAALSQIDEQNHVNTFKDASYTTCPIGDDVWKLSASQLRLDNLHEVGTARNVVLRLHDLPVFYFPWMRFPLSDARKSGFLIPSIGNSSKNGFELSTPYYWNIAPNMDATITPRIMSDRGLMLQGQYRYLMPTGKGEIDAAVLPDDQVDNGANRWMLGVQHQQHLAPHWYTDINFNRVSDKTYLQDFGSSLSLTSTAFLEQRGDLYYYGTGWAALGRLQSYQTVDPTLPDIARPYSRLPQFLLWTTHPDRNKTLNFHFRGESVYFQRSGTVQGERIDLRPSISFPIHMPAGFLVPKLALDHTQYLLNDTLGTSYRSRGRTLPIFSVDSGIYLERNLHIGRSAYVQTLEPRLFYLYVPKSNQNDIPVFDSGFYDISFPQLFLDNRFSGTDRIGDANQLTMALTSRLIDSKRGWERLRASFGRIYYFRDREVVLPGQTVQTQRWSDMVFELSGRLSNAWHMNADYIWDPSVDATHKTSVSLYYRPGHGRLLNLSYRYYRASPFIGPRNIEQTDVSFRWPLNPQWSVVGRWNYSLTDDVTLEGVGGVEYESCCWAVRAVVRRYLTGATSGATAQYITLPGGGVVQSLSAVPTGQAVFDNAFFIQVELKGLAGLGRKTVTFLKQNIPGYEPSF